MQQEWLRLHPPDNLLVAVSDLPSGQCIPAGGLIHNGNLVHAAQAYCSREQKYSWHPPDLSRGEDHRFLVFPGEQTIGERGGALLELFIGVTYLQEVIQSYLQSWWDVDPNTLPGLTNELTEALEKYQN